MSFFLATLPNFVLQYYACDLRSHQKQSQRLEMSKIFLEGACPQIPLVRACLHTLDIILTVTVIMHARHLISCHYTVYMLSDLNSGE